MLNRSHGNPCTNQRKSRQREEVCRTPLRRGQVRLPLQCPETASTPPPSSSPAKIPPATTLSSPPTNATSTPSPLRNLPRRHHSQRRLAEAPPTARRGRPSLHPPRRNPRYRANTELRRARRQAEADTDQALDRYIDSLGAPSRAELASFPQFANTPKPAPNSSSDWPPTDEKTGRPLYFVG